MRTFRFYCLFFVVFCFKNSTAQTIVHAELLGRPSANSVLVQMHFSDSVEVFAKYGTSPGQYPNQTTYMLIPAGIVAEIAIQGLQTNTKYFYRISYRKPGAVNFIERPEHSFHTQRAQGQTFTFTVQADPHLDASSDTSLYRVALNNQLLDQPDFMIDLGDFLMTDKLRNSANLVPRDTITYRAKLLRSYYESVGHSIPLFIALGNHEGEAGWYNVGGANNIAVWNTQDRKKYFPNPVPDNFYSGDTVSYQNVGVRQANYAWTWGDALFIVLDPYWFTNPKPDSLTGWRWTLGKQQYDWLKTTLEKSNATYKFVFSHQIIGGDPEGRGGVEYAHLYEWGGENKTGGNSFAAYRPGWYKPIKDLLTEHRVNIFFHGHDHFFGKQQKECMVYQETPQPSLPQFTNALQAATYGYIEGQILPNSGHLRITVSPAGIQTDYVRAYKPSNETSTRHNRDISATYFIGKVNCYDSITGLIPTLWNTNYTDELVYPNPFTSNVQIEFSLKEPDILKVEITDVSGKLVRTLLNNSHVPSGKYRILWDGKSNIGDDLPEGTYFYSVIGLNFGNVNGKMIITR